MPSPLETDDMQVGGLNLHSNLKSDDDPIITMQEHPTTNILLEKNHCYELAFQCAFF